MPFLDSAWGYVFRTLTDSGGTLADSEWGYDTATLANPGTSSDSPWGFWGTVTLRTPHHPFTVLLSSGERHIPIGVLIGGVIR